MNGMNAKAVLDNVNMYIERLETESGYGYRPYLLISKVCEDLEIFDWWNESLSLSQLKKMKKFLEQSIALDFDGYVCFKVGAKGCSHGMWAHKEESVNGYSPDCDCLFHSFRAGDNYWNAKLNGEWHHDDMNYKAVKELVANAYKK